MNDIAAVLEIAAYAAVVLIPAIFVNRVLGGSDGPGLEAVFRIPLDQPWPRGVQEEELTPWRLDALARRPATRRAHSGWRRWSADSPQ